MRKKLLLQRQDDQVLKLYILMKWASAEQIWNYFTKTWKSEFGLF
jgi:hypothetical protein